MLNGEERIYFWLVLNCLAHVSMLPEFLCKLYFLLIAKNSLEFFLILSAQRSGIPRCLSHKTMLAGVRRGFLPRRSRQMRRY
jgi:hypothetical protein